MPTIAGMRRRGFTAYAIRDFCDRIGVTKSDNYIEAALLENCVREDLNNVAPRRMAVLNPLKVVLSNYPEDKIETLQVANHPQDESLGIRPVRFSRELYIDHNDFLEVAPNKKFKRLVSGGEVRLRNAYVIRCDEVIKDQSGNITELHCSYDEVTLGANPEGRKVKGVIHWVSAAHVIEAEVRLYDRLFSDPNPDKTENISDSLNPDSLMVLNQCYLESSLADAKVGETFQFEREGYFCLDAKQHDKKSPVFNRSITLRDTWAKIEKQA